MLWIKAFHIIFVVAWFAGLFYLPRLFVYHVDVRDDEGHERFCTMEKRLHALSTIAMAGVWILGVWMVLANPIYLKLGWLHAKVLLVFVLSGFHGWLRSRVRAFAARQNRHSARFYRLINEVPAVFLVAIVVLVVVKPF